MDPVKSRGELNWVLWTEEQDLWQDVRRKRHFYWKANGLGMLTQPLAYPHWNFLLPLLGWWPLSSLTLPYTGEAMLYVCRQHTKAWVLPFATKWYIATSVMGKSCNSIAQKASNPGTTAHTFNPSTETGQVDLSEIQTDQGYIELDPVLKTKAKKAKYLIVEDFCSPKGRLTNAMIPEFT